MDINSLEAKIIGQRVADGYMEFVPNGIRDRPRRQVYGITTQQRFYRFDEDSNTYNILAKNRDRFEMVRCLNPGETVLQDDTFTNLTLLPDKTLYENCKERYIPEVLNQAWRVAVGSALVAGAGYVLLHASDILGGVRSIFAGRNSAHIGAKGATEAARKMHRMPYMRTDNSRVDAYDPHPSETGWSSAWQQAPQVAEAESGLLGPLAAGVVLGAGAAYAVHNNKKSQQQAGLNAS